MENQPKPLFLWSLSHAQSVIARYRALCVSGRDATTFLQGQLTADVAVIEPAQLRLAALLTPQGRVLTTPWLVARDESILLLLPAPLATPVRDGLQRYVLRAKVTLALTELDSELAVLLVAALAARAPESQEAPSHAPATADADARWALALIAAGQPEIGPETSGEWIPQMLNLDLLDAISWTKGCYTGQEIAARTQNLGRIKRRMFRYAAAGVPPPAPKAALYAGEQKIGEVVLAAATATGAELLAVVNLDARAASLALADGATCRPMALPYAVP